MSQLKQTYVFCTGRFDQEKPSRPQCQAMQLGGNGVQVQARMCLFVKAFIVIV